MAVISAEKVAAKRVLRGNEMLFAVDMAREAGGVMREGFRLGMERKLKADRTLVTEADLKINGLLLNRSKREFPDYDILAEEASDLSRNSPVKWVCDPVDGTMSYCRGIPTCVFSLALVNEGVPVLGVVYDPFMDRMFTAVLGEGAFVNRAKISVSGVDTISGSAIGHASWNSAKFNILGMWDRLQVAGASPVMFGSITYMGAMVACGEFSANIHPATSSHDSAALKVIVEEAGGKVTDLFGNEQRYDQELRGAVMSNGRVHDELLDLIRLHLRK